MFPSLSISLLTRPSMKLCTCDFIDISICVNRFSLFLTLGDCNLLFMAAYIGDVSANLATRSYKLFTLLMSCKSLNIVFKTISPFSKIGKPLLLSTTATCSLLTNLTDGIVEKNILTLPAMLSLRETSIESSICDAISLPRSPESNCDLVSFSVSSIALINICDSESLIACTKWLSNLSNTSVNTFL